MKAWKYPFVFLLFLNLFPAIDATALMRGDRDEEQQNESYVCDFNNHKFVGKTILLNINKDEPEQQLFLLQNLLSENIWVDHVSSKASASAGWSSELTANSWSAMALNEKDMEFRCAAKTRNGHLRPISCRFVLRVCRAVNPSFGKGNIGNYWVVENQPNVSDLIQQVQNRGIKFQ